MFTRLLVRLLAVASLTLLTNCVTPMAPSEIDALTTCPKGTNLSKVKKNLLLSGYGIQHATDDELITDYKQSGGRQWQRVTALKMDDDLVKFKVRIRRESYESVPTTSTTSVTSFSGSGKKSRRSDEQITTTENRAERVQNDADLAYYVEYRKDYEQNKSEICGGL
jgi:hypothetical protein